MYQPPSFLVQWINNTFICNKWKLLAISHSGLSFDRPKKPRKERSEPDPEEKRKYEEEAKQFAMSLVEGLGDPDGNKVTDTFISCTQTETLILDLLLQYVQLDLTSQLHCTY